VAPSLTSRTNDEWLAALRCGDPTAVEELGASLRRSLAAALRDQRRISGDDLADITQDALLRIVEGLDSFRGDARFTTWATAVAIRVAFTELRRRGVRDRGRTTFDEAQADAVSLGARGPRPAHDEAGRNQLLEALDRFPVELKARRDDQAAVFHHAATVEHHGIVPGLEGGDGGLDPVYARGDQASHCLGGLRRLDREWR